MYYKCVDCDWHVINSKSWKLLQQYLKSRTTLQYIQQKIYVDISETDSFYRRFIVLEPFLKQRPLTFYLEFGRKCREANCNQYIEAKSTTLLITNLGNLMFVQLLLHDVNGMPTLLIQSMYKLCSIISNSNSICPHAKLARHNAMCFKYCFSTNVNFFKFLRVLKHDFSLCIKSIMIKDHKILQKCCCSLNNI